MKGITIKLPESTLRRLRDEARATGRSVAAMVRERVEAPLEEATGSVYARTADLAGGLAGRRKAATNSRRRFRRT
jgi:predicted DNA-binding protein